MDNNYIDVNLYDADKGENVLIKLSPIDAVRAQNGKLFYSTFIVILNIV